MLCRFVFEAVRWKRNISVANIWHVSFMWTGHLMETFNAAEGILAAGIRGGGWKWNGQRRMKGVCWGWNGRISNRTWVFVRQWTGKWWRKGRVCQIQNIARNSSFLVECQNIKLIDKISNHIQAQSNFKF